MNGEGVEGHDIHPVEVPGRDDGEAVRVRATVVRGDPPSTGPHPSPYRWTAVARRDRPDPRTRSIGGYVLLHEMQVGPRLRFAYTTHVDLFPDGGAGGDGDRPGDGSDGASRVLVEEQVHVEQRSFLRYVEAARDRVTASRERWRRRLERWQSGPDASDPAPASRRILDRVAAAAITWVVRLHALGMDLLDVPDRAVAAGLVANVKLRSHLGRRSLWESLREPRELTVGQRFISVGILALLGVLAVLLLNSVFALAFPAYAGVYRYALGLVLAMALGVLFLPVVVEPMLVVSTLAVGPVASFAGMLAGKLLGAWMLYLIGITLVDTVRSWTEGRPRIASTVDWMTETADEHALPMLFVGNLLPFVSGFFLYVYALAGVRFRAWMTGIALGTGARFAAIIVAVQLVGPDRVSAWLAAPF